MTPTQLFSCEICEIFKNSFFAEHFWWLLLRFSDAVHIIKMLLTPLLLITYLKTSLPTSLLISKVQEHLLANMLWKYSTHFYLHYFNSQKQPPRSFLRKRCSENMPQIYMRTPMPKCNFNNIAKQKCNFVLILLHIFRTTFPKNTSRRLLLNGQEGSKYNIHNN